MKLINLFNYLSGNERNKTVKEETNIDLRIIKVKNDDGSFEMVFHDFGHMDYCEIILNILVEKNNCFVVEDKDLITDREVTLKFGEISFMLIHHYIFGNYLLTANQNDVLVVEELANNVINSIKQKLEVK